VKFGVALVALFAGSCAAPQPEQSQAPRELAGRTAGPPQQCVSIEQAQPLRVSDTNRHTLIYGSGKTLYANDLGPQCGFGSDDILITEPIGSSHCRGDIVRSFDRLSRIPGPSCVLGDWVPFRR